MDSEPPFEDRVVNTFLDNIDLVLTPQDTVSNAIDCFQTVTDLITPDVAFLTTRIVHTPKEVPAGSWPRLLRQPRPSSIFP